jgi:alkylhydroperoxidase family enzyme
LQEVPSEVAEALADADLERANLPVRETRLLQLIETQTRQAYRITDRQMDELRNLDWSDEEIFEAVFDGALFNFFTRIADAYGLEAPDFSVLPEEVRQRL